jgi:ATP-dependent helicase HrpA
MREWKELSRQLETLAERLKIFSGDAKEDPDSIHRSLLAGLLGRIGKFDEEERNYRAAHQLRFTIHPSSSLKRKTPPWVMAGELVDTAKLFARNVTEIDPRWIEPIAGNICRHSYHSPEWDANSGFVRATEQVTLYGLVIVPARRCDYSRIDFAKAREIFIRRGIIDGDFPRPPPPLKTNFQIISSLRRHAEQIRRLDAFNADGLEQFFNKAIPPDIASADALRKWLRYANKNDIKRFTLNEADWRTKKNSEDFPETIKIAGKTIRLSYRHAPDKPDIDGITCTVKKSDTGILRLWRSDWLVPGMLSEKLRWYLCALPSQYRRLLSPLEDAANIILPLLRPGEAPFIEDLRRAINSRWGFSIPLEVWQAMQAPPHLRMRFRVIDDESSKIIAATRNLEEIPLFSPPAVQQAVKSTSWTFDDIPESVSEGDGGWKTTLYPALSDEGDGVVIKLYPNPQKAQATHAVGVTRLFLFALGKKAQIKFRRDRLGFTAALYLKNADYNDERIASDISFAAVSEVFVRGKTPIRSLTEFNRRQQECQSALPKTIAELSEIFNTCAAKAAEITNLLDSSSLREETLDSISTQLAWLLYRGYPRNVPLATLRNYRRYLNGAAIRIERAKTNPLGDIAKEAIFSPYWEKYREAVKPENQGKSNLKALMEYRWMLEEFRISLFAQELHTPQPVSPKRLDQKWAEVEFKK